MLILLQVKNSLQVCKFSIKATRGVSTSTGVLIHDSLSPTASDSSDMKTPDPKSLCPSASLKFKERIT